MTSHIAFIGGGNMALAIVGGLLESGHPADHVWVSDPQDERRHIASQIGAIRVMADNDEAAKADIVVLAVKPHLIEPVCRDIGDTVRAANSLVMSVAAGVTTARISAALGGHERLVRIMPNTPALVRRGASGLFADSPVSSDDRARTESLVSAFGQFVWVDNEDGLHAITATSGSGPAYFFQFMEHLEREAMALGLSAAEAALLVRETAAGAAAMAQASDVPLSELRRRVTSPGGTTEAAIAAMAAAGFDTVCADGVAAARRRSIELAQPDGDD